MYFIVFYSRTPLVFSILGLGFGLHHGWAVEGAIGSQHKIDTSYLSPHVNMSARLEAATKQFGIPLLLSGSFIDQLSRTSRMLNTKGVSSFND